MPYELGGVCRRKSRSFTRCETCQTVNEPAGASRDHFKFSPHFSCAVPFPVQGHSRNEFRACPPKVRLQFNIRDPGFRTPHHGRPASWHLAQPAEWEKTKPCVLDLGRMNQLTTLVFCV